MRTPFLVALTVLVSLLGAQAPAAVGRIPGQFGVSPLGSAQYSIPLWTPPGIRGIQPKLALTYDSHLSYGIMGPGWTLSGLSSIARCNKTFAQDGTPAPITLTTADGYCMDGNRLRGVPAGSTTTYQTEIANFSQVTATAGTNGPSYFTVQGKDGLTYEYGNTTDSKILPCSSGCATPYIWALDKVTDRYGNQMTFTYYQAGGAYVPLSIQYTAPSGSTSFPYQVSFHYTTKASNDLISSFIAGSQIQQTQQLSTITMTSSGTIVREYELSYATSPTTLRARLDTIQECGNPTGAGGTASDCLPATTVGYQAGTAGVASPATATGSGATNGTVYSVDVNGDGRQDLVFASTNSSGNYVWWVQLATAAGYGAPISTGAITAGTTDFLLDDFATTGGTEILAPLIGGTTWYVYQLNAAGTAFTATATNVSVIAGGKYSSADVDGDGRPDIVSVKPGSNVVGSSTLGDVIYSVQLNTSTNGAISFATTSTVSDVNIGLPSTPDIYGAYGNNQLSNSSVRHFDFDGDGRQDIVLSLHFIYARVAHYLIIPILSRGANAPVLGTGNGSGELRCR